MILFWYSK